MSLISENIKYLRKQAGYTQEQFANQVGIKRSVVGAYEEARAEPRLQTLMSIAEVLNVNVDDLISKDLTGGKELAQREKVKILSITVDKEDNENIELIPQKAAAGYLNGYSDPEYLSELPRFHLPMLPKNATYRAFEISGDSMLPIPSGSIVIGKYLESVDEIKNGKTYVLLTEREGVVYKRVFNYIADRGKLYLVSDNKSYSAYEIEPKDVIEVWEAKAYISIQFPDPESASELSLDKIAGMVMNLQHEVNEIKRNITD
ncbi:XRE family transcriptional regulator [Marinoscillum furvescens]|uniref:DNA-binding XRE family transcriptional regulator n=1 Tax=Marinoscillum furvescens DSM 4134 TaxID=1122208 RepID=A0A3D9KYD0_MARFU|nr:LexA family transcriptional regulator [Marinoscillum furvescens]RED94418.1 DNA-binding XRE family transcriptional regulator [Marinoscillum furvescens DSM 4134]